MSGGPASATTVKGRPLPRGKAGPCLQGREPNWGGSSRTALQLPDPRGVAPEQHWSLAVDLL